MDCLNLENRSTGNSGNSRDASAPGMHVAPNNKVPRAGTNSEDHSTSNNNISKVAEHSSSLGARKPSTSIDEGVGVERACV